MEFAGSAAGPEEAIALLKRVRPDVVLIDYQLPGEDGILLCRRLKEMAHAPRVLIYSAYSDPALAIAANLAGADGVASNAALADELLDTIRLVARGRPAMPLIPPAMLEASVAKLDPEDVPIFSMMMHRTPRSEVAATVGIDERELGVRQKAILVKLRVEAPRARLGS
jgi:DNA-binding NarL/FixJ family response regulator